jgi:hypothetical protein
LNTVAKLLPTSKGTGENSRRKRGLLDIGGEVLKFLFGVVTTPQLEELHNTVERIRVKEGDVIHAMQQQITYLRAVDEEVVQNTIGLVEIARILKSYYKCIESTENVE